MVVGQPKQVILIAFSSKPCLHYFPVGRFLPGDCEIPGIITAQELAEKIDAGYVIVIMKLPLCAEAVLQYLHSNPDAEFHYFENISRTNEFYTSDPAIIKEKKFPYFSLMVIDRKQ